MDMNNETRRNQARHLYLSAREADWDTIERRAEVGSDAVHVASDGNHDITDVVDTLANVRHYADAVGVDWAIALGSAEEHYRAERIEAARDAAADAESASARVSEPLASETRDPDVTTCLSAEGARVVGLLVADWNDREDGPEDVYASDATWDEIRVAFPLPACSLCGLREVPATTPVGVNDQTDHAEHPLCASCLASRQWTPAAIAATLKGMDPRQTLTVLNQRIDIVEVDDNEGGYVFRGTFYADPVDAADAVIEWDAEIGS